MDWFSWLSRTKLQDSLIYEYGLSFSHNELEYEDIAFFNHEFLQSMGISIAKHRLEILKLARHHLKPSPPLTPRSISRVLMIAIRKTGTRFSEYVRALIRREESSSSRALVVVPRRKGSFLKRNKRSVIMPSCKEETLLLTNGTPCRLQCCHDGIYAQEVKWDSMFQNLKPT
ncbi:hypothetical protein EUTSA_v10019222mg [Eutrema salsugineum]|uniref:SAM domain-containing protein n=1 Tax=Eutrema salsugineum TaxID=72664 RepID=V4KBJ2_EUTSA|nr:uncharacterized protein LOC18008035 [Eutrema salsugineum]ESQ27092.1 hypothetical protein EUTSA_v10019222mg [Eutrema salsugineum]